MGYVNKRDRFNAIKKVKIAFGTFLGCEKDEDAEITLREPSEMEVLDWKAAVKEGEKEGMGKFKELLVNMLVTHNLMEDEEKKMSNEDVVDLIFEKTDLTNHIAETWSNAVFTIPQSKNGGK